MTIVRPKPPTPSASTAPAIKARPTPPGMAAVGAPTQERPKAAVVSMPKGTLSPLALPKEESQHEAPKPRQPKPKAEESRPASEPVVPGGEPADSGQPSEDTSGTPVDGVEEKDGQLTRIHLKGMNVMDKYALWKKLNRGMSTRFVTLLRVEELPKRLEREDPPAGKPAGRNVGWCCYCGDWTIFEHFVYVGSDRCIGCGMSTKDYYNRSANNLWKADV